MRTLSYIFVILELCNLLPTFPSTDLVVDYFEGGLHQIYLTQYNIQSMAVMSLEQLKTIVNKLIDIRIRAIGAHMADPLVNPPW